MKFKKTKLAILGSLLLLALTACSTEEKVKDSINKDVDFSKVKTQQEIEAAFNSIPFEFKAMFSENELKYIGTDKDDIVKPILEYIFKAENLSSISEPLKKDLESLDEKSRSIVFLGLLNKTEDIMYSSAPFTGGLDPTLYLSEFTTSKGKVEFEDIPKAVSEDFDNLTKDLQENYLAYYSKNGSIFVDINFELFKETYGDLIPETSEDYLESMEYVLMLDLVDSKGTIIFESVKDSTERFSILKEKDSPYKERYVGVYETYLAYLLGYSTIYNFGNKEDYTSLKKVYQEIAKGPDTSVKKALEPLILNLEKNDFKLDKEGSDILISIAKKELTAETFRNLFE